MKFPVRFFSVSLSSWVVLLAFFWAQVGASADEQSHAVAAEELLKVSRVEKMLEDSFEQIKLMQQSQIEALHVPQDQQGAMENVVGQSLDYMKGAMSWDNLKGDLIKIYMDVFTEEEIAELVSFYNTPLGQKLLDKMPDLMNKTMQLTQKRVLGIMPQVQSMVESAAANMEEEAKEGVNAAEGAGEHSD